MSFSSSVLLSVAHALSVYLYTCYLSCWTAITNYLIFPILISLHHKKIGQMFFFIVVLEHPFSFSLPFWHLKNNWFHEQMKRLQHLCDHNILVSIAPTHLIRMFSNKNFHPGSRHLSTDVKLVLGTKQDTVL